MGQLDPFVADPDWGHWIVWYFFLGGIAAGAYAVACLARLFGGDDDRRALRVADYLATPLVMLCGIFLVVDLGRPERFWHMLIQSETYRPMFKWWSPMSAGSWGLSAFGAFSGLSLAIALVEDGRLGFGRFQMLARRLTTGWLGRALALGGLISALFLGSYTGSLLTATNQPIWAQSTWLSPLFLASAVSTGISTIILICRFRRTNTPHDVIDRVERLDLLAIGLELAMLVAFAVSLGGLAYPALSRWPGNLIPLFVVPAGLVVPLGALRFRRKWLEAVTQALVLLAGFALRYAIVHIPGLFRVRT
jgi:formate-dependent nitrite reductase membrane component NrfD